MASEVSNENRGKIQITDDVKEKILSRQGWKCYHCRVHFHHPGELSVKGKFRQIKSRREGHGYHKKEELEDYKNLAFYCMKCYAGEVASKVKSLRFKRVKLEQYEKILQENPRYKKNFTMFVNEALDWFVSQDYLHESKEEDRAHILANEHLAENFDQLLKMYNERENDLEFANEVVRYFDYYTPRDRSPSFEEKTSGWSDEERRFLKRVADREMKRIIEKKGAGYKYYMENPQDFREA